MLVANVTAAVQATVLAIFGRRSDAAPGTSSARSTHPARAEAPQAHWFEREIAEPVLQHRMALSFAARADGMTVRDVIAELKAKIS